MGKITLEEAARRLQISRAEAEEWLTTGALAGEQVGGNWQIEEDSLETARRVRETQEELAEEGYLDPAEIADTTLEAREDAEAGDEGRGNGGDEDRAETVDPRELSRD